MNAFIKVDGCKKCRNNKPGFDAGLWCINNCISGFRFISIYEHIKINKPKIKHMNLYQINVGHFGPKDNHISIECLLLALNDEAVYEFIKSEPQLGINGNRISVLWAEREEEDPKYKDNIIRIKGELYDEEVDCDDAYYGITHYGWELLKENVDEERYQELVELEVCFKTV